MRIATTVLIVLAGITAANAQQSEQPSFYPPKREVPNRPLFPQPPFDWKNGLPLTTRPAEQSFAPPQRTPQPSTGERSGSVCLKTVPVDPSIDREFVRPVPDTRSLPMRIIEMPPCVMLAPQPPR